MNKLLFFMIAIGLGVAAFISAFAPVPQSVSSQDAAIAQKHNLGRVQANYFHGCRTVLNERADRDPTSARLRSLYPDIPEKYCACLVKTVGTPDDFRLHRITGHLIQAAMLGRDKPRDDDFRAVLEREGFKAVMAGGSRDELRQVLKTIMTARRSCARGLRAM